ncbi:MAG: hypothetical protein AAGJ31_14750, partial [Verrucomicrobiota bacterium]
GLLGNDLLEFPAQPHFVWNRMSLPAPASWKQWSSTLSSQEKSRLWNGILRSNFRKNSEAENAEEALLSSFGKAIFQEVSAPFHTQFWGMPLEKLTPDAVTSEADLLDFSEARQNMGRFGLGTSPESSLPPPQVSGLWAKEGLGQIATSLANAFQTAGGRLVYGAQVSQILVESKRVTGVLVQDSLAPEGDEPTTHEIPCTRLLSTVPLRGLVKLIHTGAPAQIHASSLYLAHRQLDVFACRLKRERSLSSFQAHYRQRSFHRVTEPKWSGQSLEEGKTLLIVEPIEAIPEQQPDALWDRLLQDLATENLASPDSLIDWTFASSPHGLPIYRGEYPEHLERVQNLLKTIPNLFCAEAPLRFQRPGPTQAIAHGKELGRRAGEDPDQE